MVLFHQKINLLRGLLTGEKAFTMPLYVNIDATHRCNLHCPYCRWHSPLLAEPFLDKTIKRDLAPDLFRRLCADLSGKGTQTLQFVGAGEPLLHPHIYDLITTAKSFGLGVLLYSNGLRLNASTVRSLIDARLDLLRVSLGDASAERFEQRHPQVAPGAFQQILDGLGQLSRLKKDRGLDTPGLELTVPIDRHILTEMDAIIDIAASTGCNGLFFSVVLDFGEEALKAFCLTPEEVDEVCRALPQKRKRLDQLSIRDNIDAVLLRYRIGRKVWGRVACYAPWYFSFIRSDGKVTACQRGQVPVGDLRQSRFEEIWNQEAYRSFRRRMWTDSNPPYDCGFCPHVVNNHRIHRYARWLLPFLRLCRG